MIELIEIGKTVAMVFFGTSVVLLLLSGLGAVFFNFFNKFDDEQSDKKE